MSRAVYARVQNVDQNCIESVQSFYLTVGEAFHRLNLMHGGGSLTQERHCRVLAANGSHSKNKPMEGEFYALCIGTVSRDISRGAYHV